MTTESLRPQDLAFVVSRIPSDIRELLKRCTGLMLAGGFIRATIAGEKPTDLDLFGRSVEQVKFAAKDLAIRRMGGGGGRLIETRNAITLLKPPRLPVQFILRWTYEKPEEVVASFDFTIAQAAIWWNWISEDRKEGKWHSFASSSFYPDLAARRLVYTSPARNEDAGGSILRVRKFLERGYNIQAPSLAAVVARLMMGVKFDEWNESEPMLAKVLTGLIREVDPLIVVDGIDLLDEHTTNE